MGPEDAELERLVARAAAGDEEAWRALWSTLEPRLAGLLRKPTFLPHLTRREDAIRDIVVAIMGRLRQNDFHRLHLYLAARDADPALVFMRWLMVVAKRVAIDSLRAHPDYVDRRRAAGSEDEPPGAWIETEELPADGSTHGARPPMTNRVTARQILRYAQGVLPDAQRRALELWAEHGSAEEIARALGLASAGEAERVVRAAVEWLRRHFREDA